MEPERIPMHRRSGWAITDEPVEVSVTQDPPVGRRISMVVNELVLAQIGQRALEAAVAQLGQRVAFEHQDEIQRVVTSAICDPAWAKPIIEEELRRAVRDIAREIFGLA